MDPIEHIKIYKDSTFAMLLEAQKRNIEIHYIPVGNIYVLDGRPQCITAALTVQDNADDWFQLAQWNEMDLGEFNIILMRKDPPFDMEYIYCTYALELAEKHGALVINRASSLRNCNEKFWISSFPECCSPTLITSNLNKINEFINKHQDAVVKPLDSMGGHSIFRISHDDPNRNAILEEITQQGRQTIMTQKYISEVTEGDKRIIIIKGNPVPYALARIPKQGEFRSNLAVGGTGKGVPLSKHDLWICDQLKSSLLENGIFFAGIDVIGDYLTEINITSPTCIRELDQQFNLNISAMLFDSINFCSTNFNQ
jgi:glutathione synthase